MVGGVLQLRMAMYMEAFEPHEEPEFAKDVEKIMEFEQKKREAGLAMKLKERLEEWVPRKPTARQVAGPPAGKEQTRKGTGSKGNSLENRFNHSTRYYPFLLNDFCYVGWLRQIR